MADKSMWTCIQLGSREHFAIPRLLHRAGKLNALLTDFWYKPSLGSAIFGSRFRQRQASDLPAAKVRAWNAGLLAFECKARLRRLGGWERIVARNAWFQSRTIRALEAEKKTPAILFSYGYTAQRPFRYARQRGWKRVLGQIDPGPYEEALVRRETFQWEHLATAGETAPQSYWNEWREEVELADLLLVNSKWSQYGLEQSGVPSEKIRIVPLAYEPAPVEGAPRRRWPSAFDVRSPLRVLFLGQVIPRKGVGFLFEAIRQMTSPALRFDFVGPVRLTVPPWIAADRRVTFHGPVNRQEAAMFYEESHVFILPTISDGFALTQLEALAHRLPVIVSLRCAAVVTDGKNGLVLKQLSTESIVRALARCLQDPVGLQEMAARCSVPAEYSMAALGAQLARIEEELCAPGRGGS